MTDLIGKFCDDVMSGYIKPEQEDLKNICRLMSNVLHYKIGGPIYKVELVRVYDKYNGTSLLTFVVTDEIDEEAMERSKILQRMNELMYPEYYNVDNQETSNLMNKLKKQWRTIERCNHFTRKTDVSRHDVHKKPLSFKKSWR